MSYLFVVVIGAIAGWAAGQYVKGSEMGVMPDVFAGAVGACLLVLLLRFVGPEAASGFLMSGILATAGGIGTLFLMRRMLKEKPVPVRRPRRR